MSTDRIESSPITKQVAIEAPPATVWRVLTDPDWIARWMSEEDLQIIANWRVGGPITFRGILHGHPFENRGTITAFEPPTLFEYRYWSTLSAEVLAELPDNQSTVRFSLRQWGERTLLELTLSEFPEPSIRNHANLYWGPTLQIIRELAEQDPGPSKTMSKTP